jgi:hypothetical protein
MVNPNKSILPTATIVISGTFHVFITICVVWVIDVGRL